MLAAPALPWEPSPDISGWYCRHRLGPEPPGLAGVAAQTCTRHCPFAAKSRREKRSRFIFNSSNALFDQQVEAEALTSTRRRNRRKEDKFALKACRSEAPHLPHEDLSPADKHGGAGNIEPLLQPLQVQLLHLLITTLHLHRVEGQHGEPVQLL